MDKKMHQLFRVYRGILVAGLVLSILSIVWYLVQGVFFYKGLLPSINLLIFGFAWVNAKDLYKKVKEMAILDDEE